MTTIIKYDAMALIHKTNLTLESMPPKVKNTRHLVDYLEQITHVLYPLQDHEPVSEVVSQLLHGWTDLFIHQETDEEHLRGLPELLLQLGAHLFYTDKHRRSTITLLPPLNQGLDDPDHTGDQALQVMHSSCYFFNAFFIPYFQKHFHAEVFCKISGEENPYIIYQRYFAAKSMDKSSLIKNMNFLMDTPWLIGEKLALESGNETFLSHILKIGSSSKTINPKANSYKSYINQLTDYAITESKLNQLFTLTNSTHIETGAINTPQAVLTKDDIHALRTFVHQQIEQTESMPTLRFIFNFREPSIAANCLLGLISKAVHEAHNSLDSQSTNPIQQITKLTSGECPPENIINLCAINLANYFLYGGTNQPYSDELFQAVFQCSLKDTESLHRLSPFNIACLLTTVILDPATHPTRTAVRRYYYHQLENNHNLAPIFTAIYCFSKTKSRYRFFGLKQATFERLLLSTTTSPINFIHDLFTAMIDLRLEQRIKKFKKNLVNAILALSPDAKSRLRKMINKNETCLALELLKTRQHTDETTHTLHYTTLISALFPPRASDYRDYDSSDDEADDPLDDDTTINQEKSLALDASNIFPRNSKAFAAYLYNLLLNKQYAEAQTSIRIKQFDVNQSFNWIQENIQGVAFNNGSGSILLKFWLSLNDDQSSEKIFLTQFLIENGLSIFTLLKTLKILQEMKRDASNLEQFIYGAWKTGVLEQYFHKIPLAHLQHCLYHDPINLPLSPLFSSGPRPITALLQIKQYMDQPNVIKAIAQDFLQPITPEQQRGLSHALHGLLFLDSLTAKLIEIVSQSEECIKHLIKTKAQKQICALMVMSKHGRSNPYAPTAYTLFKRKHLPKPVPEELLVAEMRRQTNTMREHY